MELNPIKNIQIKKSKNKSRKSKILILTILIVFLLTLTVFVLSKTGAIEAYKLGRQIQSQQEQVDIEKIVLNSLKEILLLPEDITPNIGTINDAETLKREQEAFFANSKNGDYLIIYPTLAIIYDYPNNKIMHIGPVQFEQNLEQEEIKSEDLLAEELPSEN